MTYGELRQEIYDLGFDTDVDPNALVSATNRVLMQLWRYEPRTRRVVLTQREPLFLEQKEQAVASPLCYEHEGIAAVSFESIGAGRVETGAAGSYTEENISSPEWRERRYALVYPRKVKITGIGDDFSVRNLTVMGKLDSIAVPLWREGGVHYLLNELFNDGFVALDGPPVDAYGVPIGGYRIEGECLVLPRDFRGSFCVEARCPLRRARLENFITEGYMNEVPDCPERLTDLLALGVAAYVWVDTEPEKAGYCKQRFDEGLAMDRLMQDHGGSQTVIRRKRW